MTDKARESLFHIKRTIAIAVLLCIPTVGIAGKAEKLRDRNRANLNRLSVGMKEQEAVELMGSDTVKFGNALVGYQTITNPFRAETLMSRDGQTFEVLFYWTDLKSRDNVMEKNELTPLVFSEGKLAGWGWTFLTQWASSYEIKLPEEWMRP